MGFPQQVYKSDDYLFSSGFHMPAEVGEIILDHDADEHYLTVPSGKAH